MFVHFCGKITENFIIKICSFGKSPYLCIRKQEVRVFEFVRIVLWCNGSTTDSGPVCPSSNLGRTTKVFQLLVFLFYGVMVAQQILVLFVQVRILVEQRFASVNS